MFPATYGTPIVMTTPSATTTFHMLRLLMLVAAKTRAYQIYNVDDPPVCNSTIWLEQGPNSAAILRLTSQPFYDDTPRLCVVTFKAPVHTWSGLLGVLEDVDLRRYEDIQHHLAQSVCIDYITISSPTKSSNGGGGHNAPAYRQEQCGTWAVQPSKALPTVGYSRALLGHCTYSSQQCEPVRELQVTVVIGRHHERQFLWSSARNTRHKGFTFVVTAYSFSYGVNECAYELRSCGSSSRKDPPAYCIHDSLFCDGHINCGHSQGPLLSMDERVCLHSDVWSGLLTVVAGPWVGAGLLLLLVLGAVVYRNRARAQQSGQPQQQTRQLGPQQEFNSYAESYEVSSNLSSAHHMAIQVRVVCNPAGQQYTGGLGSHGHTLAPWKPDMPPSYETLFPHGPPQEVSNVPHQTHSPLFAQASEALGLTSSHSLNSNPTCAGSNTYEMTVLPHKPHLSQPDAGHSQSSQQATGTQPEEGATASFSCSRSLDRRVPLSKGCSRSSSLIQGGRINSEVLDERRYTLVSDPPSSPPSYDSDVHGADLKYDQSMYATGSASMANFNTATHRPNSENSENGSASCLNYDNQNMSNQAPPIRTMEESHRTDDEMTLSGVSESTHYQSCSDHNESHDEGLP